MLIFRRSVAIFLTVLGTLTLVLALVTRVAYAAVFDTNTYVKTVSEVVALSEMRSDVSKFATDSITDGLILDDPSLTYALRRVGINPTKFTGDVRDVISSSVDAFMNSEQFATLWANTNRTAHESLMTVLNSDSVDNADFTVDASALVVAMANSITDPKGVVTKFIPLKQFVPKGQTFTFKLIDGNSIQDLRDGLDAASKIRWALLIGSVVLLFASWLIFGRTRGAHRMIAISLASAGIITLIAKSSGTSAVADAADDKTADVAKAIYGVITSPLTGYAVALIVLGAIGVGATFYRRTPALDQASGSL